MYNPEKEYKNLINKLRKACKQKGYTYYALAKEANIANSTMYNIMNEKTMPHFFTLLTLCNVLGVSVNDRCEGGSTVLEEDEKEMLESYRNFSKKKKEWLNIALKMLAQCDSL